MVMVLILNQSLTWLQSFARPCQVVCEDQQARDLIVSILSDNSNSNCSVAVFAICVWWHCDHDHDSDYDDLLKETLSTDNLKISYIQTLYWQNQMQKQ